MADAAGCMPIKDSRPWDSWSSDRPAQLIYEQYLGAVPPLETLDPG